MWCLETTERIEMIPELAEAFADHLLKYKKALDESYKAFHGIMNTPFDIEGYPDAKEAALGMNSEGLRMVNRIDEILSATVKPERVK